jgi:Putative prokaryotic signal transducing protein
MADDTVDEREWGTALVVESNEEAIVVAGFLHSNGIPAEVESLHSEELPVNVGGLGEVRVRVPQDHLQEALRLLEAQEKR